MVSPFSEMIGTVVENPSSVFRPMNRARWRSEPPSGIGRSTRRPPSGSGKVARLFGNGMTDTAGSNVAWGWSKMVKVHIKTMLARGTPWATKPSRTGL